MASNISGLSFPQGSGFFAHVGLFWGWLIHNLWSTAECFLLSADCSNFFWFWSPETSGAMVWVTNHLITEWRSLVLIMELVKHRIRWRLKKMRPVEKAQVSNAMYVCAVGWTPLKAGNRLLFLLGLFLAALQGWGGRYLSSHAQLAWGYDSNYWMWGQGCRTA